MQSIRDTHTYDSSTHSHAHSNPHPRSHPSISPSIPTTTATAATPASPASPESPATRARALAQGRVAPAPTGGFFPLPDPNNTHPENTTVFIGGLPPSVGRDELGSLFEPFGAVTYINVPPGKGCGFVSFDTRPAAEWAIERMQGFWLRGAQLRLAWGRVQAGEKAKQPDLGNLLQGDTQFLSQMLGLSMEQHVKLELFMEFANRGDLARLKKIVMSAPTPSESGSSLGLSMGPVSSTTSTGARRATVNNPDTVHLNRASKSTRSIKPSANTTTRVESAHTRQQEQVDRLVDTPSPSPSPPASLLSISPSLSPPSLSMTRSTQSSRPGNVSFITPTSVSSRRSEASLPLSHGASSISDEAVFRAFHPNASAPNARSHNHHHQHSANCVTPSSLYKLEQQQYDYDNSLVDGHGRGQRRGWNGGDLRAENPALGAGSTGLPPVGPSVGPKIYHQPDFQSQSHSHSQSHNHKVIIAGQETDDLAWEMGQMGFGTSRTMGFGLDVQAKEWVPGGNAGGFGAGAAAGVPRWAGSGGVYGASGW